MESKKNFDEISKKRVMEGKDPFMIEWKKEWEDMPEFEMEDLSSF